MFLLGGSAPKLERICQVPLIQLAVWQTRSILDEFEHDPTFRVAEVGEPIPRAHVEVPRGCQIVVRAARRQLSVIQ